MIDGIDKKNAKAILKFLEENKDKATSLELIASVLLMMLIVELNNVVGATE